MNGNETNRHRDPRKGVEFVLHGGCESPRTVTSIAGKARRGYPRPATAHCSMVDIGNVSIYRRF